MSWTPLRFGKHIGKTLPQVLFVDPDWFFWAYDKGIIKGYTITQEASKIHAKATSIRVPQTGAEPLIVEYNFFDGKSYGFDIVEKSRPQHAGSTVTIRGQQIDMSVPMRVKGYDKLGYKLFIGSLKSAIFGKANVRMTKEKCEAFFDDDSNFVNNS